MKSRRLQFLTDILVLLFALDLCATANRTTCISDPIQFTNPHRCFGSASAIPPLAVYINSTLVGTLGGTFLKNPDVYEVGMRSSMLILYPVAVIPLTRSQDRVSDWLRILLKMYFMPAGPARSYMRRSFRH